MPAIIDLSRLLEIRKKFKELPKVARVKTFSAQEALEALKKDLRALSRKGYDPKEIADFLKQEGLSASVGKIRKLLTEPKKANGSPAGPEDAAPASPVKSVTTSQPGPAEPEDEASASPVESVDTPQPRPNGPEDTALAASQNPGPFMPFSEKDNGEEAYYDRT